MLSEGSHEVRHIFLSDNAVRVNVIENNNSTLIFLYLHVLRLWFVSCRG